MTDASVSPTPPDRPDAGEDQDRTRRSQSNLQLLLVVSVCFETVIFAPILFFGAPPAFLVIGVIAGGVSTALAMLQAQKHLSRGTAFALCIVPLASWAGVVEMCFLLHGDGVSESFFRGAVVMRAIGLLAIARISSLAGRKEKIA